MSRLNPDPIIAEVGDSSYELKPTLRAYDAIESRFGGLRGALDAVQALSVSNLAHIIAAGAGLNRKEATQLREDIFENRAVVSCTEPVTSFVMALFSPPSDDAENEPKKTKRASDS